MGPVVIRRRFQTVAPNPARPWKGCLPAIHIAGLLLISATTLAADEPAAPHPVHHPESSLMLAGDWLPEDPHSIDFSELPRVPSEHAVINDVRAPKGVNQHNYLVHHNGRFFAMWSDGPGIEDRVGQRVKFATSPDGLNWNEPRFLTPEPPDSGPDSPLYGTRSKEGFRWISRGFWQRGDRLYALASLDEAAGFFGPSLELHAFRLNADDGAWEHAGVIADDTINNFPPKKLPTGEWMISRRPHNYKATGVQFLIGGVKAIDEWESFPVLGTSSELAAEEPLWWRLPDDNLMALFRDNRGSKFLYRSFSTNNGRSWSKPARTNFPDATSKLHGLRLSDGRYVLVSNSNPKKRDPLTIAISDDGMVFHKLGYLVGGRHVDYPYIIEHDRHLLVAFAGGKQTVEVLKIRLDDLKKSLAEETKTEKPLDGELKAFLGKPELHLQPLFDDERFPNITVTLDGTVLATWGNQQVRARRSEDGGKSWGEEITIAKPGFHGGGTTVDETTGDVLAFVEAHHPPAPLTIYRSKDQGKTWQAQQATSIKPDSQGNMPSMHMNEHGITLRHGPHKGRLLRPTRFYAGGNKREEWPNHYTNAIYSDDGGVNWQTSEPFPENGTGEATLAELSDGRIYYNSRVHWQERPQNTRRRHAWSEDGGETWKNWSVVDVLPDGHQHRSYGCMGGLVRLPVAGKDILIFSNIDTPNAKRERATVWASFDGGETWPVKRLVDAGPSAYSSLTAGRPGTPSEGWIYLHYEAGPGSQLARFNLTWLSEGESTGDGEIPHWLKEKTQAASTQRSTAAEDQLPSLAEAGRSGYLSGDLIYPLEGRPTPQCHASTITETPSGLVAAWFGGTHEKNPDVGIWLSRHDGTTWSRPVEVVDGSEGEDQEYACWNPVLFQARQGPLMLFYKVGVNPRLWWGMLTTSTDDGKTWSKPRRLGQNSSLPNENQSLLGPVKNKPIQLANGDILCPSSTENEGWKVHFERTSDLGKTWEVIGPIHDASKFNAIQPSILTYPDDRMQILCRTQESVIAQSWSDDGGKTWCPVAATELPNPNSGTDAVTLSDGRQLLVYNHTVRGGEFPAGRNMLNVAISSDGKTWKPVLTLEREKNSEFSYPAVIQTSDGKVQITYTWKRRSVKHVVIDPAAIAP